MQNLRVIVVVLTGFLGFVLPAATAVSASPVLSFGIVPQQAVTDLARSWTPLLAYLSKKTGYTIEFRTGQGISTFEQRVSVGEFDFVYLNPLHYTTFRATGYQAIAKERNTQLVGIVVVPKNSKYKSLMDLQGAAMAFPSPTAFAATILPQLSLKQQGVNVVPKYVASHESVYRAVARQLYPAGGGIVKTYEQVDPSVRDQLRVLWKSHPYTPHPVAVHPRVPREAAQRMQAALLAMADDPKAAALLKDAGLKGFVIAKDGDYEDIRKLQISIGVSGMTPKEK